MKETCGRGGVMEEIKKREGGGPTPTVGGRLLSQVVFSHGTKGSSFNVGWKYHHD